MWAQDWYRDPSHQTRYWRYWTVWPPCLLALALSGVIVIAVVIFLLRLNGPYSAGQVGWTLADAAGQAIAGLSAALLAAAASQPGGAGSSR